MRGVNEGTAMDNDQRYVDLLGIFDYVVGAIALVLGLCPSLHLVIGILMLVRPESWQPEPPPPGMGWIFAILGGGMIALAWTLGLLLLLKGRCMRRHRHYVYCFAVAAASCLFLPLGTVLGVLSIIVLTRPGAKALFGRGPAPGEQEREPAGA
jgi:hypothetical protein